MFHLSSVSMCNPTGNSIRIYFPCLLNVNQDQEVDFMLIVKNLDFLLHFRVCSQINEGSKIKTVCLRHLQACGQENQLDATQWFIELVICSTCFGHLYAHYQELETTLLVTICGM
jgi:hypothetical protein